MSGHTRVVVVGTGFSGIAVGIALNGSGQDDFVVLERGASVGGTWRENTYPGIACDVPSHLYGFSGHPWPAWSGLYAAGAEIREYLEQVAAREIGSRLRLGSPMTRARWDAAAGLWRLAVGHDDEQMTAEALVLACGRLTEPLIPDIVGLETFPGPMFHSARWDHSIDLAGARVAVVGTGASATQIVPEVARRGAAVTVFQRTPAWIVPRGAYSYTDAERRVFAQDPARLSALRRELYLDGEARFASRSGDLEASAAAREAALAHLRVQVPDRAMRAALTPGYSFGCKRVLLSDDYYPTLASGQATLEPSPLAEVRGQVLVGASGRGHVADVLILATGFASTQQPYADLVHGEAGSLAAHWSAGMTSYLSTVVSGFPNLFVLNGPNASLGHNSAVLMAEEQAGYIARTLGRRRAGEVLRVDPAREAAYSDFIDAAAATTPWLAGGCRNWYVDERSGRLTLLWPGTVDAFRSLLAAADGSEFLPATGTDSTVLGEQ